MILAGIFLGLASGLGAAFGTESLTKSFKDEESVEKTLKLPVLATIQNISVAGDNAATASKLDKKIFASIRSVPSHHIASPGKRNSQQIYGNLDTAFLNTPLPPLSPKGRGNL